MAGSLQGYQNSILAGMGNTQAQQAIQRETPGFDMFSNVNTNNVPGMDMLSPTERARQEYDSNAMRVAALNKEVEIGLGSRIDDVMSDAEKQRYINSLTKNQYEQMLKYKDEGYGFMASKELLENSYKLSNPNATGLMKYKDYAEKDAYYNNNPNKVTSLFDKYVANPIGNLAKYWNVNLGYGEDAAKDNMSFADRFANLTLGNIINGLDTYLQGQSGVINELESKTKTLYDRVVKGYDTDWDFYDKDREEGIIDKVIDSAFGAGQSAMGALGLLPGALPFTATLSTKPGEVVGGLTVDLIGNLVDFTLDNTPLARQVYHSLSEDSQDKLSTGLAMVVLHKAAKGTKANLEARAEPYLNTAKSMIRNGLEKGVDYAKAQAGFEEFSKVKGWSERADGTFVETENYKPGYRGRIVGEFWEGFKEGVREKFNNPNGTNLSEIESTEFTEGGPSVERTSGLDGGNKTNVNGTQTQSNVNSFGATQLRQWNKMTKAQGIKFANKYGTDYGTWMAERGFNQSYDNNINALWDYANYMQGQKGQALGTITQRYREPAVDDMLAEAIQKADYIKSDDLNKLINLALKNREGGLTPSDIDYVRQWFGYNFPLRFDGTDVSGTIQRNNNMYTKVREVLERIADENGLPQLRDINREIAATHHIIEATTRHYNGLATNDVVSLKDLVTLAGTVANPKAWPLFAIQQALKMPSVRDAILSKLVKGKTNAERTQIKIDFDKIRKIQDEAEQRRLLEEWIAKWNLKVEEAAAAMQNRLPENITQGGVVAGDRGIVSPNPTSPTYQEMGLGNIRETASPQYLLRAIIQQLRESNLIKDISVNDAINKIMAELSPDAQAKLATIAQKLASGQQLTEQEGKIVEKLADVIRQDQDSMGVNLRGFDVSNHPYKDYIEWVPVEELKKFREFDRLGEDANPDSKENIENLRQLIRENKLNQPLILQYSQGNRKALLVEGNHRIIAAELEGLDAVPVRVMRIKRDLDNGVEVTGIEPNQHGYVEEDLRPSEIGIKVVEGGLDNPEGTDINNTNLPTNPTNNGGNGEIYNTSEPGMREGGRTGTQENGPNNENEFGGVDRGGNQEIQGGDGARLGEGESVIGKGEEVIEITNVNEALDVIDSILDRTDLGKVVGGVTLGDTKGLKTYTNSSRNAAVSVNKDGAIVEYVQADDAPKGAADELIIDAIDKGANKITVDDEGLVEHFEKYGFRVVGRTRGFNHKFFMIHNGDAASTVRGKLGNYIRNVNLAQVKEINPKNAKRYMNKMLKENVGYKLENVDGWDGLQNYDNFGENFKTPSEIADYVLKSFRSLTNDTTQELFDTYNKELLEAKEIYNGHIDTSDLNIVYLKYLKDAYARFSPLRKSIEVGETDGFTLPHEYTHYNDRKFFKELTGKRGKLSDLAHALQEHKRDRPSEFKNVRQELVWDFVDIYSSIEEWGFKMDDIGRGSKRYGVRPTERMARRGEAFVNAVKGGEPISTRGEQFTNKLVVKYAEWLGKMDRARVNGDLHDGSLYGEYDWSDDTFRRGYHGSHASFDKFDSTHMGEGEGAQAHGYGHYIAVREGTAENYATLKERRYGTYDFTIDGKPYREVYDTLSPEQKDIFDTFKAVKVNDRSFEESRDYIENKKDTRQYDLAKKILSEIPEKRAAHPEKPKEYYDMMEEDVRSYIDSYEKYEKDVQSLRDRVGTSSNMYEVEIPDPIEKDTPTGNNYLEEEDLMSADAVQDFVYRFSKKYPENAEQFKGTVWSNSAPRGGRVAGWEMYTYLADALGGMKQASKFLEDIGYDGIHYFGNRDGEAYVIFNDDAIDIVNHRTL